MSWIAHIIRMPDDYVVKKIQQFKVTGIQKRGRPRLRWTDTVESDFGIINEKTWRTKRHYMKRSTWLPIQRLQPTPPRYLGGAATTHAKSRLPTWRVILTVGIVAIIRKQNFLKSLSLMQGLRCEVTNVLCSFELIIFTAIALSVHNFQLQ
ncbi:hypothetical protein TNCV_2093591 [Trichonephila clavipes]|nr:hypothetical protein TNCV_2093591 [Trichonephila clavipes]